MSNALLQRRKRASPARDLRIDINPKTGEIRALASLTVCEKVMDPFSETLLAKAQKFKPDAAIGDPWRWRSPRATSGASPRRTAKQAMLQRIRGAEKEMMYDEFKDRAGEIVSGTVRRFERSDVILDLGKFGRHHAQQGARRDRGLQTSATACAPTSWRWKTACAAPRSSSRVRTRISCGGSSNWRSARSTTAPWKSAGWRARPGTARRSPSTRPTSKVDPVGACVGMRGSRVKNIVRELNNEKVDIIRWHEEAARVHPGSPQARAHQEPDARSRQEGRDRSRWTRTSFPLAIGKRGQNARAHRQAHRLGDQHREGRRARPLVLENKVTQAASMHGGDARPST